MCITSWRLLVALALMLPGWSQNARGEDWTARLARPRVTEAEGQWNFVEHGRISYPGTALPDRYMTLEAHCPIGKGISRDSFLKYTSMGLAELLSTLEQDSPSPDNLPVAGPPESAFKYEELDRLSGPPDLTVTVRFDSSGVEVEVRASGRSGVRTTTQTWDEFFE